MREVFSQLYHPFQREYKLTDTFRPPHGRRLTYLRCARVQLIPEFIAVGCKASIPADSVCRKPFKTIGLITMTTARLPSGNGRFSWHGACLPRNLLKLRRLASVTHKFFGPLAAERCLKIEPCRN